MTVRKVAECRVFSGLNTGKQSLEEKSGPLYSVHNFAEISVSVLCKNKVHLLLILKQASELLVKWFRQTDRIVNLPEF